MPKLDVHGTSLNFRIDGPAAGPVVLLSNSLASALAMWDHQVSALTAAGFRVARYDSRGHGESDAPRGEYRMETLVADALAVLDAVGVERAHFCGLSMGGMVGQSLGAHHGDRILSLTLCDTAAHMAPAELWDQRIEAVRAGGMAAVVDATIDRWFTKAGQARVAADVAVVRGMILGTPIEGFCGCCAAIRDMDQRPSLGAVRAPTLVLVGKEDPSTPVEAARYIHERVAGSELVVIPEAAHLANVEQPGAFNAALLGFLARHRAE